MTEPDCTSPIEIRPYYGEAFDSLRAEIDAVPTEGLPLLTLDVTSTVATVLGAAHNLEALAERMAKLPETDLARIAKLGSYARAAQHAHTLYLTATRPTQPLVELADAATALRALLYSDAVALMNRGLLPSDALGEYRGTVGYKTLAVDLLMLAKVMREHGASLAGKTALQPSELARAEELADRLLVEVGAREQSPASVAETTLARQKAFALLLDVYAEARRAVLYLRFREGDADRIAPSLYAGRRNGNHRPRTEDDGGVDASGSVATPTPSASNPTNAGAIRAPSIMSPTASVPTPALSPDDDPFYPA